MENTSDKIYHRANKLNQRTGQVSALCYKRPKAIDLTVECWTNRDEAVNCPRCLAMIQHIKDFETVAAGGTLA